MDKQLDILSKRYNDDGIAEEYLTYNLNKMVNSIRDDIVNKKIEMVYHEKCPLCKWTRASIIALKDRMGLPLETLSCTNCGLIFSDAFFSNDGATYYYSKYYSQIKNRDEDPALMFKSRIRPAAYSWLRFNWVKNSLGDEFSKIKTVMEIGSNDGCNLYPYLQNKCNVFGCDFDEERMKAGRTAGITLLTGGIERLKELSEKADLVIFSHSLEHMPDVDLALQNAKDLLAENGKIYIEVPGIKFWNRANRDKVVNEWIIGGNNFLMYLVLDHAYCFEWNTLSMFTRRNELTPIKGDEFIRSLFKVDKYSSGNLMPNNNYKNDCLQYLLDVEKDWQQTNPLWRRAARRLKQRYPILNKLRVN